MSIPAKQTYYRSRPRNPRFVARTLTYEDGTEILDDKPHPELLASSLPVPLHEQIANLTRLSAQRRQSILDALPEDYFGEELEDDLSSDGLTPYEVDGFVSSWDDIRHVVPEKLDVSGDAKPSPQPTVDQPDGVKQS